MKNENKLVMLERFFSSKTSNNEIVYRLGDLFLNIDFNKSMIYQLTYESDESVMLKNYLDSLPNDWDSMESLFDQFITNGEVVSRYSFQECEDLYSLELFKRNKNSQAKVDWAVYYMTVLDFKSSVRRFLIAMLISYGFFTFCIELTNLFIRQDSFSILNIAFIFLINCSIVSLVFVIFKIFVLFYKNKKISLFINEVKKLKPQELYGTKLKDIVVDKTSIDFYNKFDSALMEADDYSLKLINFI